MKETGKIDPINQPQEEHSGLTKKANTPYAKSGVKTMTEDTNEEISKKQAQEELIRSIEFDEAGNPRTPAEQIQAYQDYLRDNPSSQQETTTEPATAEAENIAGLPPEMAELMGLKPKRTTVNTDNSRQKEAEKAYRNPESLEEVLEAVANYDTEFHKDFPLFTETGEYQKDKNGNVMTRNGEPIKEKKIHDSNFLRYVRKRMRFFESEDGPDTPVNYFQKVGIEFGPRSISIHSLIEQETKYFKDLNGVIHEELAQQIRRELFVRSLVRSRDISYRTGGKGMGDDGGIAGVLGGLLKDNNMTRNVWSGKSMWHWLLDMPQEMKLEKVEGHGDPKLERNNKTQDTRIGRGIATGMMAYYHLADFTKLQEMLGKDSSFFTRKGFEKIRKQLADNEAKADPFIPEQGPERDALLNKIITDEKLDEIFNEGKINPNKFIDYVNFFVAAQVDPRRRGMVRGLMAQAIGEKYKLYIPGKDELDEESLLIAEEYAFLTTRWTGIAARNDLGAAAYDAQAKILRTQQYRFKQASDTRGGAFGNLYNVGLFKALGVNYLDSIRTQDDKLLREVLEDLVKIEVADDKDEAGIQRENEQARRILSNLNFPDASESNLSNNGINRWFGEYESFIGGKELHLQKVVEWAQLRGVVYDPQQFGELIQEGFLKPLRYGYSTWPNMYDKTVRDIVKYDEKIHAGMPTVKANDGQYVFQDMSMAESMLGNQVIDIKDFWTRLPKLDKNGNPIKGQYEKELSHHIDAGRISDNKPQLFKQMALARIAADIYSHRDRNSPYQLWDAQTVEALIKALERVPGALLVDENNLQNSLIPQYFFKDEDIKYLRSLAHVTKGNMLARDGGIAVAKTGISTAGKFLRAFIKGIK